MSRYSNRLAPPPTGRSQYQYDDGYGGPSALDDDEDDDTAVATDLSVQRTSNPRRGVSFGENEVEEFHGSEAPDAVMPARSRSRMGHHPSSAQAQAQMLAPPQPPQGIGRPRSTSMDARRSTPLPPPAPPAQSYGYNRNGRFQPVETFERERDRAYGAPTSFARSHGYADDGYPADDGYGDEELRSPGAGDDDDDMDAYSALGTGVSTDVATDTSLDPASAARASLVQRYGYDPRQGYGSGNQGYSAAPAPRTQTLQVRRSPVPPPPPPLQQRYSASGYQPSDFSVDDIEGYGDGYGNGYAQQRELMPPPPVPRLRGDGGRGGAGLAPPRSMARPASTGSMRMLLDEDGEGGLPAYGGLARPGSRSAAMRAAQIRSPPPQPPQRGFVDAPPSELSSTLTSSSVPEDTPVEKELIALLKELRFSIALKDFHDAMQIGVQKTLVAEDGMGHAYCKVHCKKLPRHEDIARTPHLKNHWVPLAGSRWEFRTASHRVTVVFKTAALAAYEAQFLTIRR
ncbi:hypothetical protein JCM10207_002298 [Rhodosporidiobolus poonsookiae]